MRKGGGIPQPQEPVPLQQTSTNTMRKKSIQELKASGSYRADRHAGREVESGALLTDLPPAPVELSEDCLLYTSPSPRD